jgi:competence protein ComEA
VSFFSPLGRHARAEQTARAHERLRALVSSASSSDGWVPPAVEIDAAGDHEVAVTPARTPGWVDRARVSPLAALGLVIVLAAAIAVAGVVAWRARARDVGAELAPPQVPQVVASSTVSDTGRLVVDVAGRVRRPGLVTLTAGARVADALRAAGGVLPGTDLTSLNLARKVVDGEQIVVGGPGVAAAPPTAGSPGPSNPLDLNTATVADLDQLPGVGPVLAQRIVDWRATHGGFTSVSQLRQVTGIGDSKYADLQPLVRV